MAKEIAQVPSDLRQGWRDASTGNVYTLVIRGGDDDQASLSDDQTRALTYLRRACNTQKKNAAGQMLFNVAEIIISPNHVQSDYFTRAVNAHLNGADPATAAVDSPAVGHLFAMIQAIEQGRQKGLHEVAMKTTAPHLVGKTSEQIALIVGALKKQMGHERGTLGDMLIMAGEQILADRKAGKTTTIAPSTAAVTPHPQHGASKMVMKNNPSPRTPEDQATAEWRSMSETDRARWIDEDTFVRYRAAYGIPKGEPVPTADNESARGQTSREWDSGVGQEGFVSKGEYVGFRKSQIQSGVGETAEPMTREEAKRIAGDEWDGGKVDRSAWIDRQTYVGWRSANLVGLAR